MAFTEDHSIFFDVDGFAIAFTYTPAGGASVSLKGIFDEAYFEQSGAFDVSGNQPQIMFETASLASAPAYGDAVCINETPFLIVEVQPDGTGITTLKLEKQDGAC